MTVLAWLERRPFLFDVLVAVGAFVVFGVMDLFRSGASAVALDAIFALALAFRRRSPGLALGIAWLGAVAQLFTQPSFIYGNVMIVAVVFATALDGSRPVRWLGLASSIAGGVIAGFKLVLITEVLLPNNQAIAPNPLSHILYFIAVSGVIAAALTLFWALGVAVRARRAYAVERLERLESDRERLSAELRVAQQTERNRITREMHDAIGHSLTVVIAQSDGARYALATDPDAASRALGIINTSARAALNDVSALLTVLTGAEQHRGALGVEGLDALLTTMEDAGLSISLTQHGDVVDLPTTNDLAVYRIVQESLTNALKHGGVGTRVSVAVTWLPDHLELETLTIESDARALVPAQPRGPRRAGLGIGGMIERARLLGGTLVAEPRTDGVSGFRVAAIVPYQNVSGE